MYVNTGNPAIDIKTPDDFAQACIGFSSDQVYELFEYGCSQDLRDAVYALADPDGSEPFRDACNQLGKKHGIVSLIYY